MFEFALTPDQRELRDGVRAFAKAEVTPISAQCAAERSLPQSIADAWHATGYPGSYYEQPDDGATLVTDGAIISEELGYADASFASYLMLPVFFNRVLLGYLFVSDAFMMVWLGQMWRFGRDVKDGALDPVRVRPASLKRARSTAMADILLRADPPEPLPWPGRPGSLDRDRAIHRMVPQPA